MPLPSTRVIHPRWAAHHQPITEDAMNATVTITHGATGGDWSFEDGEQPGEAIVTYTGAARVVYVPTQARDADAVGQEITTRRVVLGIPREVELQVRTAVVVVDAVDANGPSWLAGRKLVVQSVGGSSLAWEQLLDCLDDAANQPATP